MARLVRSRRGARSIAAVTPEEHALLAHALSRGGELALLEGLYAVSADSLAVPDSIDREAAEALRSAFEHAALAHRDALLRRRRFRIL